MYHIDVLGLSLLTSPRYAVVTLSISSRNGSAQSSAQRAYNAQYDVSHSSFRASKIDWGTLSSRYHSVIDAPSLGAPRGIATYRDAVSTRANRDDARHTRGDGTFTRDAQAAVRRRLNALLTVNLSRNLKFITLTVDDAHKTPEWSQELREWQNFQRRLKAYCERMRTSDGRAIPAPKIIGIPELGGKTKRLHWHAIVIAPYISKDVFAREIWGRGFCDIRSLKMRSATDTAKQIAHYVSKYVTKDVDAIPGRKRIYYASKNWTGAADVATLTRPQAKRVHDFFAYAEAQHYCPRAYVSACNFDGSPVGDDVIARLSARRRIPSALQPAECDVQKYVWHLSARMSDNFRRFCASNGIIFEERGILGKTPTQRDCDYRRKQQAIAFDRCRYDSSLVSHYTAQLSPLFPRVPAGYIYGVLRHLSAWRDDEPVYNNFDVLDRLADKIDFASPVLPPVSRAQAIVWLDRRNFGAIARRWKYMVKFRYCDAYRVPDNI